VIDEKDCNNCAHHRQGDDGRRYRPLGFATYDLLEASRRIDCANCLDTPPEGEKLPFWQPLVRR
jgi:hypothetical protein